MSHYRLKQSSQQTKKIGQTVYDLPSNGEIRKFFVSEIQHQMLVISVITFVSDMTSSFLCPRSRPANRDNAAALLCMQQTKHSVFP